MSRRVLAAILVVAGLAIVGFGAPLAVAVQHLYRDEAMVRLGREAARAGAQVPASLRTSGDPVELPSPDSDIIGRILARRIAKPVADLAAASARRGGGDFTVRLERSGIAELGIAADNLDTTAIRLGRLVERERAFSTDASHQLRTPLTGLRLHLENALANPSLDAATAMTVALGEVDRLERTIDNLLTLARDTHSDRDAVNVQKVFDDLARSWPGRLAATGRPLMIDVGGDADTAHASPSAVGQILEALMAKAIAHGSDTVALPAHAVAGGVAIDVSDQGPGVHDDPDSIFQRRSGSERGHGIGLARSLAEAEDA